MSASARAEENFCSQSTASERLKMKKPRTKAKKLMSFWSAMIVLIGVQANAGDSLTTISIDEHFIPSGWMGDGMFGREFVELNEAWRENPFSEPTAIRVEYRPGGEGWAGIYWQNEPNNWGELPGEDFSANHFNQITFWAKGEHGGEVVEFKAGGIEALGRKHRDSFSANSGRIFLQTSWQQYSIDLHGMDLSSVIGGFAWIATGNLNPGGLVFYLDDIKFEP